MGLKATILLSPLLGITYIILLVNPGNVPTKSGTEEAEQSTAFTVFIYLNNILQGFQGAIVSTFYCFVNSEIQRHLKRKFYGLQRRISNKRAVSFLFFLIFKKFQKFQKKKNQKFPKKIQNSQKNFKIH